MTPERETHHPLQDEQGDWSFSRGALLLLVPNLLALVWVDTLMPYTVPPEAYATLLAVMIGFISWAGGRAVARYLGPQLAGVAGAITARLSGLPAAPAAPAPPEPPRGSSRPIQGAADEYSGPPPGGGS